MGFELDGRGRLRADLVKVVVMDKALLAAVEPAGCAAHLAATGWREFALDLRGHLGIWQHPSAVVPDEGSPSLQVPRTRHVADYRGRVSTLLTTLAKVEGRTQLAVACELLGVPGAFGDP